MSPLSSAALLSLRARSAASCSCLRIFLNSLVVLDRNGLASSSLLKFSSCWAMALFTWTGSSGAEPAGWQSMRPSPVRFFLPILSITAPTPATPIAVITCPAASLAAPLTLSATMPFNAMNPRLMAFMRVSGIVRTVSTTGMLVAAGSSCLASVIAGSVGSTRSVGRASRTASFVPMVFTISELSVGYKDNF